jgi:hypothetical protein
LASTILHSVHLSPDSQLVPLNEKGLSLSVREEKFSQTGFLLQAIPK